ncbi:hypothetical protein ES705_33476 [subsurface metagenome]
MTIDEAIKIQEEAPLDDSHIFSPRLRDAIKLGKEALKRIQLYRPEVGVDVFALLPGEDPE